MLHNTILTLALTACLSLSAQAQIDETDLIGSDMTEIVDFVDSDMDKGRDAIGFYLSESNSYSHTRYYFHQNVCYRVVAVMPNDYLEAAFKQFNSEYSRLHKTKWYDERDDIEVEIKRRDKVFAILFSK